MPRTQQKAGRVPELVDHAGDNEGGGTVRIAFRVAKCDPEQTIKLSLPHEQEERLGGQ